MCEPPLQDNISCVPGRPELVEGGFEILILLFLLSSARITGMPCEAQFMQQELGLEVRGIGSGILGKHFTN